MCSKRDIVLFLAGAQTFHTLSHLIMSFTHTLPIHVFSFVFTPRLNIVAIIFNGILTGVLLWWAYTL